MHLVLLGTMRRLLYIWVGMHKGPWRLTASQKLALSEKIVSLGKCLPSEFTRKSRSLNDLDRWKATELRTFLLYIGPIALNGFLSKQMFEHFMLLHFSTYVLTCTDWEAYLECAAACLQCFVQDIEKVYGAGHLVYNVHILVHLTHFTSLHGNLDAWSVFPFENHLFALKRRIRGSGNVMAQAINRIQEMEMHHLPTLPKHLHVSSKEKNNVVLVKQGIVMISSLSTDNTQCHGTLMDFVSDIYTSPYPSRQLHIGLYTISSRQCSGKMMCKCVSFPSNQPHGYYIIPLVQSFL